jgi:hypothetical protein
MAAFFTTLVFLSLQFYGRCQKNVPIADRFFATASVPPSFFGNILMTSGIIARQMLKNPGQDQGSIN